MWRRCIVWGWCSSILGSGFAMSHRDQIKGCNQEGTKEHQKARIHPHRQSGTQSRRKIGMDGCIHNSCHHMTKESVNFQARLTALLVSSREEQSLVNRRLWRLSSKWPQTPLRRRPQLRERYKDSSCQRPPPHSFEMSCSVRAQLLRFAQTDPRCSARWC